MTATAIPIVLAALTGCDEQALLDSLPPEPSSNPAPVAADGGGQLDALTVAPAGSMSGYSREKFDHWSPQPEVGTNCNTREAVLLADGDDVDTDTACEPVSGSWISAYTGETITDDSELDIDHVVPLANAWRSGANEWSDQRREQFANDVDGSPQLLAVDASSNRSKGDQGPESWSPEINRCEYATSWIEVKHSYELTVTAEEHSALASMLADCDPAEVNR